MKTQLIDPYLETEIRKQNRKQGTRFFVVFDTPTQFFGVPDCDVKECLSHFPKRCVRGMFSEFRKSKGIHVLCQKEEKLLWVELLKKGKGFKN